ncbi:MAG: DegT/DnrJ/EryC1/StrS family aminotransferase [Planctomycetes bacterium]|nr:DegT/DnrJ/EryC1/StrS family aminotransferase [Planctomycetota bacterium]
METLAVQGGEPICDRPWVNWPVCSQGDVERVANVVRSGTWAMSGPEETAFRTAFARFLGVAHGTCVTNGTHALQLALEALDVGFGDEVIVPGLTWQATAACALDVNAVPVLVDVDPRTLCMDPEALQAAITPRTKAIIAVHLYSAMADLDRICEIAERNGLPLIEDCSHQHGSEWRGRKAGAWGSIAAFSMQQSKVLTSGEGGFIGTSDPGLARRLDCLRHCGRPPEGTSAEAAGACPQSGNYRMTEMQAALLNAGLERLEEQTVRRDRNAQRLSAALAQIEGITPPYRHPQVTRQAYYAYAFRYDKTAFAGLSRARFAQALATELRLPVAGTYEPLNASPLYKPLSKRRHRLGRDYERAIDPRRFELPECARAYREIVTMLHPMLLAGEEQVAAVAEGVRKIQRHADRLVGDETTAAVAS